MIRVIKGDITSLDVDCIVNAANERLLRGGGVCGAIFRKAGPDLDKECFEIGECQTGDAKMTLSYDMTNCNYICHAVGPVYTGSPEDADLLSSAYKSSLDLALAYGCSSIAFPAISCGIFGYPIEDACSVAFNTVKEWLISHKDQMEIILCCFDDDVYECYKTMM